MGSDMQWVSDHIDIVMIHYPLSFAIPRYYSLFCLNALSDVFSHDNTGADWREQTY